jgi:3',5'-cyclic AMP phosphodiesterase CpdA
MLIAQISDLHIRPAGQKLYDYIDTNQLCARHVALINALAEPPDAVVITGDITNCGCPKEYDMARQILAQLDFPTYIIPGNHDCKHNFIAGLGSKFSYLGNDPENIAYTVENFPIRMLFVDSSVYDRVHGFLETKTLDWIRQRLVEDPNKETILFMHHHPLASGCLHMDTIRCLNGEKLIDLLKNFPQVTRIICGHTHRAIFQQQGSLLISTGPATAHQVPFDTKNPNGLYNLEPPAMMMHRYSEKTGLVSFVTSLAPHDGPFRFEVTNGCPDVKTKGV